tara:strand:+ start:1994 stop:3121 length:1128 start_codon:yes stop_codon:yes gene_type:complete
MSSDHKKKSSKDLFPFFEISGPAKERGRQYGCQAGDLIRKSVEIYKTAFEQKRVAWGEACELARHFVPRIRQYNKAFMEELEGIAQGAELPVEEVVAINARTELMYGVRPLAEQAPEEDMDGCTGAIAMSSVTANGHTLHGQNWDWRDECADSALVLKISPEEGPDILTFVEAGILARCGMNSKGIALTGNFLQGDKDFGREGTPAPILRRQILMSSSFAEALQCVFTARRAFSNNLMISEANGECIDLETTPDEVFWICPDNGVLVHANHFVAEAAKAKLKDIGVLTNADSLYRDVRVRRYLEERLGRISSEDFQAAFADMYGSPKAVCRVPVAGPGGKTSSTVATIIMDTTAKVMWIAKRPYGPHEYQEFRLD